MRRREVTMGLGALAATAATREAGLEALRWKRRIVLVFAPSDHDERLIRQRRELEGLMRGPDDRDLTLVMVAGETVTPPLQDAAALRRRFHVRPAAFEAILIGKDGGVKLRSSDGLAGADLASTIDAMPMRRGEMRKPSP